MKILDNLEIKSEADIDPFMDLEKEINTLRKDMNAIILSHYYQEPELQDIADFVGDSLELSKKATQTDADVIVFCGVKFMADVAKILNPEKLVLLPDLNAGCSLEDSCPPDQFKKFVDKHPDHKVLTYINSSAEVKALSDIIVTSSSAEKIINQIPEDQPLIFGPDKYLGAYLEKKTGRKMVLWQGTCIVHEQFSEKEVVRLKTLNPDAKVIAHPECPEHLLRHAEYVGSTSGLLNYTKEHAGSSFIVLTEPGIVHQMKKISKGSTFFEVEGINDSGCQSCNSCPYMRLNTLEKLYLCMVNQSPKIQINPDLSKKAKVSIDRMLEMSIK